MGSGQPPASGSMSCSAASRRISADGVICGAGGCKIASRHGGRMLGDAASGSARPASWLGASFLCWFITAREACRCASRSRIRAVSPFLCWGSRPGC